MTTQTILRLFSRSVAIVMLVVIAGMHGCDISDPTEGIVAKLNTKERATTISVVFQDAATGEPVTDTEVHARIFGQDQGAVIDLLNQSKREFFVRDGFLSFAVRDELRPDTDTPVRFTITATADGYISTSQPVSVVAPGNPVEINMVNTTPGRLPAGVTGEVNLPIGSMSGGQTTEDINFQSSPDPANDVTAIARFAIQEGTQIRDEQGNPLNGDLVSTFHLFNSENDESLHSFPGGFSANIENIDEVNETESVDDGFFFITGGFLSMNIEDQNGRQAAEFNPPMQVSMELSDDQLTEEDGREAREGDTAPIWSYNEEDGAWRFEQNAPISQGENRLEVQFESPHLSWWNIDWIGPRCWPGLTVNLIDYRGSIRAILRRQANDAWLSGGVTSGDQLQFLYPPANMAGKLEFYDMHDRHIHSVENIQDLCQTIDITLPPYETDEINVTFRGRGICEDPDDIELRPNFPVWYRPADVFRWTYAGTVQNGEINMTFPSAQEYVFGGFFDGRFYQYTLDLSDVEDGHVFDEIIELPQSICDDL